MFLFGDRSVRDRVVRRGPRNKICDAQLGASQATFRITACVLSYLVVAAGARRFRETLIKNGKVWLEGAGNLGGTWARTLQGQAGGSCLTCGC